MRWFLFMVFLHIDPGWLVLMALLWYWDPLGCFYPFCAAMALHELGHLAALSLLRVPVRRMRLDLSGAVLETGATDYRRELVCALAGPAANCLGLVFWDVFPLFARCCLLLGAFNLLPLPPLDGGKALRAFLLLRCNTTTAFAALMAVTWVTAAALMLWALCLTADHGLWPVAAAGLALLRLTLSMKKHL